MFVVLDTNHFTEFADASVLGKRLMRRITKCDADVFTCIVTLEETNRGWLALLSRHTPGRAQLNAYAMFQRSMECLIQLPILPFDEGAANLYHELKRTHPRLGTMDLKIAAICIAHEAILLTRNLKDFSKLPGLHSENWLD